LTNARREQLNAHRPAQTTLAHSNVLATSDTNLMKMDLHVEVTTFDTKLKQCNIKVLWCESFTLVNCYHLANLLIYSIPLVTSHCNAAVVLSSAIVISRHRRMHYGSS